MKIVKKSTENEENSPKNLWMLPVLLEPQRKNIGFCSGSQGMLSYYTISVVRDMRALLASSLCHVLPVLLEPQRKNIGFCSGSQGMLSYYTISVVRDMRALLASSLCHVVRTCHIYDDEYSDCVSIRSRFQQYFVFGQFQDCNPWKHDYLNCLRWQSEKDRAAVEEIVRNEEVRRQERLSPHYKNPVWEDRSEPPSDWNAPLPPFLAERQKGSYLEIKAKELKEGNLAPEKKSFCVIM